MTIRGSQGTYPGCIVLGSHGETRLVDGFLQPESRGVH
jgi:hypothetical protein